MLLSLQRRQQQEELKERKELEAQTRREQEKLKEETRAKKKEEEKQRRAAILEQHKLKKAIEEAEREVKPRQTFPIHKISITFSFLHFIFRFHETNLYCLKLHEKGDRWKLKFATFITEKYFFFSLFIQI